MGERTRSEGSMFTQPQLAWRRMQVGFGCKERGATKALLPAWRPCLQQPLGECRHALVAHVRLERLPGGGKKENAGESEHRGRAKGFCFAAMRGQGEPAGCPTSQAAAAHGSCKGSKGKQGVMRSTQCAKGLFPKGSAAGRGGCISAPFLHLLFLQPPSPHTLAQSTRIAAHTDAQAASSNYF
jgi:hypothetical protein